MPFAGRVEEGDRWAVQGDVALPESDTPEVDSEGPAAGPSDQANRALPLCASTAEIRFSTKPGKRAWTAASMASMPAWPSPAITGSR